MQGAWECYMICKIISNVNTFLCIRFGQFDNAKIIEINDKVCIKMNPEKAIHVFELSYEFK